MTPIEELCETISVMVMVAGFETFQPKPGWMWFETLKKFSPGLWQMHVKAARRQGWDI